MAPLRLGLAAAAAILISLSFAVAPGFAARAHLGSSHARHATRCGRAAKPRGKAGSFRAGRRPRSGSHRSSCKRSRTHRLRRHTAKRHPRRPAGHRLVPGSHPPRSAAADGGCPNAELRPSQQNLELIRAATICLINRERSSRGEPALQPNGSLERAAQGHTENMVFGNYFEHLGPGGQTPQQRMRAAGYIYSSNVGYEVGENLAWGTGSLSTPQAIVAAWMASPGHRANILDARYRDTAVGVSPSLPGSLGAGHTGGIYTQDFGVIITA